MYAGSPENKNDNPRFLKYMDKVMNKAKKISDQNIMTRTKTKKLNMMIEASQLSRGQGMQVTITEITILTMKKTCNKVCHSAKMNLLCNIKITYAHLMVLLLLRDNNKTMKKI